MTSVFVGGSRRLGRVNAELARRLDNIIDRNLCVLVGDANGFDRATQQYCADNDYREVVVYCTQGQYRNNVGDWPIHAVPYNGRDRGREFYTAKDDAMLRDADYGLFAWDGKSKGTLRNVQKMAERLRPCLVYISSARKVVTVRDTEGWESLASDFASFTRSQLDLFSDSWREKTPLDAGCTPNSSF